MTKATAHRRRRRPALMAAVLASALGLASCDRHHHGHEHDHEGHDHAGHDHGHGEQAVAITHFTEQTELFVELPPLVVGEPAELAVHLTRLSDFRAVATGRVVVELSCTNHPVERVEVGSPAVAGIFRAVLQPEHGGERQLTVRLATEDLESVHALGAVTVHATVQAARKAEATAPEAPRASAISFLKEQQWQLDFATAVVAPRRIRPSFEAYGTIKPRPNGEAHLTAPVAGRLSIGPGFPRIGLAVEHNQALVALTPLSAQQADTVGLERAVSRAEIALRQAEREQARLEGLLAEGAVPERRVSDARFAVEQAQAELRASRRRLGQAQRVQHAGPRWADAALQIRSPIAGTVVSVGAAPGSFVAEGAHLARVIDLDRLWLEVQVAETHAALLADPRGVWFTVEGFSQVFEAGPEQLVATGGVLDERTRTVHLFVEIPNPGRQLRVGMFAEVHVLTADPAERVAVPVSAVVYEGTLPVVYVQLGGESFERRPLRLDERDGDWIAVREGLRAGERIVTRGAYAVRLAAAETELTAHGHGHQH